MARGRPAGQMTHRRRQVLDAMTMAAAQGEPISFARLARRCGLYDYREARRIVADLRKLGLAN
jgi:DNA-binding IscR family transcriptional regulator